MDHSPPSIKELLRLLFFSWARFMTGPLSIALAVAAIFVDQGWYRLGFICLSIVCILVASCSIWMRERTNLISAEQRIKAKVRIEYLPYCDSYFGHEVRRESPAGVYVERRALVTLRNIGLDTIDQVEIFCTELDVLRTTERPYVIVFAPGRISLHPGEPWVGIVKQVIMDCLSPAESLRQFQIQIPTKILLSVPPGNEFLITLLVTGRLIDAERETFRFGEKAGVFYFERANHGVGGYEVGHGAGM